MGLGVQDFISGMGHMGKDILEYILEMMLRYILMKVSWALDLGTERHTVITKCNNNIMVIVI